MRLRARSTTLRVMGIEPAVQVTIEIEHTSQTVRGQICAAGRTPTRFFGWLELIDQLERAATGRPSERPPAKCATGETER